MGNVKCAPHISLQLHEFPPEPSNPHRHGRQVVCAHLTRTGGLQQSTTFQAHEFGISR